MTIALGILSGSSVVLAADTEVGVEYLKMGQGKLSHAQFRAEGKSYGMVVTGSGNVGYLTNLKKHFTEDLFKSGGTPQSTAEFEETASAKLEDFYSRHVIPFLPLGSACPDAQIVVAYSDGSEVELWASENNVLTNYRGYAAVGSGEMYARILLNQLFVPMWPMTDRTAKLLAAYVVMHVKDCIPGCGKETDLMSLTWDGNVVHHDRREIQLAEELFRSCGRVEADTLRRIFGDGEDDHSTKGISREIRNLRSKALRMFSPTGR